jgi:hypothetical protein
LCLNKADIVCVALRFMFSSYLASLFVFIIWHCRYDCVGGKETWVNSHCVLKAWGKFVTIAGDEQAPLRPMKLLSFGASMLGRKLCSLTGSPA